MTVLVHAICDFCRQRSSAYPSVGGAVTDLLKRGWTLMVIKRKTRHRCAQCTRANKTELAEVVP